LTALALSPPELVTVAARAGYRHVGLRLLSPAPGTLSYPLIENEALRRETKVRADDTGVEIFDIEVIRLEEGMDFGRVEAILNVGRLFSAKELLVVAHDKERSRLIGNFARVCELARKYDHGVALEFMPWIATPDLQSALEVVTAAKCDNGGILIDFLHFIRSGGTVDMLRDIPRNAIRYVQISDDAAEAPPTIDEIIRIARSERTLPGKGGLPLREMLDILPQDLPVGIEMPITSLVARVGYEECLRQGLEATKSLLRPAS
jgi:sugar phosphate isomerase/epimerase